MPRDPQANLRKRFSFTDESTQVRSWGISPPDNLRGQIQLGVAWYFLPVSIGERQ